MGRWTEIRKTGPIYQLAYAVLTPYIRPFVRLHVEGMENLPAAADAGGSILVSNHLSNFDPLNVGYVFGTRGREIHFLAKSELFKVPVLGWLLRTWGMIPVDRSRGAGARSLTQSQIALAEGKTICVFFEGTITKDPGYWPMRGKTGAARLALDTGAPLVPMVQWGTQNVMERYSSRLRFAKTDVFVRVLPELDISDITSDSSDRDAVQEVTRRLQVAMTEALADIRGESAPLEVFDPADAPDKKSLKRLSGWRRKLGRASRRQEILSH